MDLDPTKSRSFTEVILKTLAIRATTTIAAGHLTSLRNINSRDSLRPAFEVVGFFFFPLLPLATLVHQLYPVLSLAWREGRRGGDAAYYLSAALGMRATPRIGGEDTDPMPLKEVRYRDLQRVSNGHDCRWLGRLVVLLLFTVQAAATLALFARRVKYGACTDLDLTNGIFAAGGLATGIISLIITILNHTWQLMLPGAARAADSGGYYLSGFSTWMPPFGFELLVATFCQLFVELIVFRRDSMLWLFTTIPFDESIPWWARATDASCIAVIFISFPLVLARTSIPRPYSQDLFNLVAIFWLPFSIYLIILNAVSTFRPLQNYLGPHLAYANVAWKDPWADLLYVF